MQTAEIERKNVQNENAKNPTKSIVATSKLGLLKNLMVTMEIVFLTDTTY